MIELVKKSDTFKLYIPEKVEKKIRYLCQQIWNNEWSGTLFYKPEGNFEDGTLVIKCEDIYVMDIGTAGYTEFDMSPDVISYMTNNPGLLDCQIGLIHSHNNMPTFFSNTDTATLKEEGIDRNHFVSLIVNNAGSYTAAITRKVKSTKLIKEHLSFSTFNNQEVTTSKSYEIENEELEWFYLNIEFDNNEGSFHKEIDTRLEEIRKLKEAQKSRYNNISNEKSSERPELDTSDKEELIKLDNSKESNYTFNQHFDFDEDFAYKHLRLNKEITKTIVLQLVTGSIIISNSSKIDIRKWVQRMVPLYEKRFGEGAEGLKLFKIWAEDYIEFLCWNTHDDNLIEKGLDEEELAIVCAYSIVEELYKLPENIYIKKYIEILKDYLI